MDYLNLPIGANYPETVNVVVEIPRGEVNKYEYDKQLKVFKLDRVLHSPVHYPGDYGFLPQTLADDGDPLDAVVLVEQPSFTGCLISVRPVGMLEMSDRGKGDQKILAVAVNNPRYREINSYKDVFPHLLKEIEHFFTIYKDLEGMRAQMSGWFDVERAHQVIRESHERFKR